MDINPATIGAKTMNTPTQHLQQLTSQMKDMELAIWAEPKSFDIEALKEAEKAANEIASEINIYLSNQ